MPIPGNNTMFASRFRRAEATLWPQYYKGATPPLMPQLCVRPFSSV